MRHWAPAPSSSEVQVRLWAVPVKLAVTVPQERCFFAVWWCHGRLTVLPSTLPPGPEYVTVL